MIYPTPPKFVKTTIVYQHNGEWVIQKRNINELVHDALRTIAQSPSAINRKVRLKESTRTKPILVKENW